MGDHALTCDRCRNSPAVTLLAHYPPARVSERVLRVLCAACAKLDAEEITAAQWQHVLIPLAVPEPGTHTEWRTTWDDGLIADCANEKEARLTAKQSNDFGKHPAARAEYRTVGPWKDAPDA